MKPFILLAAIAVMLAAAAEAGTAPSGQTVKPEVSVGALVGYNGGAGFHVNARISRFAVGFPLSARFGLGRTSLQPGDAADARRIFINDATNGTPEESGRYWDFRLDFMYPVHLLSLPRAFLYAGPRHSRFTGNFKYIGGNEDFDVKTNQWGIGGGLEAYFAMSPRMDLVLTGGFDYYTEATLTGHDTSYSPDGDDVNPREGYSFDQADEAIAQPQYELRLMMGVAFNL